MAVERMNQISMITFLDHREDLLKELQQLGNVHVKELDIKDLPKEYSYMSQNSSLNEDKLIEYKSVIETTIKALKPFSPKKKLTEKRPVVTYDECCNYLRAPKLLELHQKVKAITGKDESLLQEQNRIKAEIEQLKPYSFLTFPPTALKELKTVYGALITIRSDREIIKEELQQEYQDLYMEKQGKIRQEDVYLLLIKREQQQSLNQYLYEKGISLLELNWDQTPEEQMKEYEAKQTQLLEERESCKSNLSDLASLYQDALIEQDAVEIILSRQKVVEHILNSKRVLYLEGWVPVPEEDELRQVLDKVCKTDYYLESQPVAADDSQVPIKLRNKGIFRSFESITEMYSLPKYNELDPTGIMAIFYILFFGLMVGDTGYGLILTLGCLFLLKFVDLKEKLRGSIKMFFYLGISVTLCGAIYGSFFGMTYLAIIPVGDGTFKTILDTQTDISMMLVLSLVIGFIHIICGLILKGMNCYIQKDFFGIFCDSILWILTLLSGTLLLLTGANIITGISPKVFGISFGICLVGLACTQGRGSKTIGGKIGEGLYGVYGLSGYIGDIVSYTRIVALGLSGAYIAFSFNLMADLIPGTLGRIIFGGVIVILGQSLNFGLSLLGAYVHSCRLQYVEFFGKFFDGGGKPYRPFKIENQNSKIKNKENGGH